MEEAKKLEILTEGQDQSVATFVFRDEDHTIGNALRYALMKNSKVDFAGYSVPHPSVNKMNLRVQTRKFEDESQNTTATECLKQGLKDITMMCDHILITFESELARYKEAHPDTEPMET
eukprot:TRINITY_DN14743_c0_g1_i1.p1 TRINITY_DN14743_c0_g1~~TRINITY_DN14743_c0_g1_i1.p1  ORF type:complete len:119 (+),score=21.12 TRINITY_DN14743_c0_g1_i1:164-520(+)